MSEDQISVRSHKYVIYMDENWDSLPIHNFSYYIFKSWKEQESEIVIFHKATWYLYKEKTFNLKIGKLLE